MYFQIAVLIIVIIGAVHVVYEKGKKTGEESGIQKGRVQILEENIKRVNKTRDFSDMVENAIKEY